MTDTIGTEEGQRCNREGDNDHQCPGDMMVAEVEGCNCHVIPHPPCSACVNAPTICDVCGLGPEDDE